MKKIKLQKFLQMAETGSRREIREMINQSLVKVNGQVIVDPNYLIDPNDIVKVNERKYQLKTVNFSYFIFNKPDKVVSVLEDQFGRTTIKNFISGIKERVFPVGRLDYNAEGIMLLTNDGDFANFILNKNNKIPREFLLKIKGEISEKTVARLEKGFRIDGQPSPRLKIDKIFKRGERNSWIKVKVLSGKASLLEKTFLYSGHPVIRVKRIAIGNFRLKKIPSGEWREITPSEFKEFCSRYNFKLNYQR